MEIADAEYFNPSNDLSRIATARRYRACPTIKQAQGVARSHAGTNAAMCRVPERRRSPGACSARQLRPDARMISLVSILEFRAADGT